MFVIVFFFFWVKQGQKKSTQSSGIKYIMFRYEFSAFSLFKNIIFSGEWYLR